MALLDTAGQREGWTGLSPKEEPLLNADGESCASLAWNGDGLNQITLGRRLAPRQSWSAANEGVLIPLVLPSSSSLSLADWPCKA